MGRALHSLARFSGGECISICRAAGRVARVGSRLLQAIISSTVFGGPAAGALPGSCSCRGEVASCFPHRPEEHSEPSHHADGGWGRVGVISALTLGRRSRAAVSLRLLSTQAVDKINCTAYLTVLLKRQQLAGILGTSRYRQTTTRSPDDT